MASVAAGDALKGQIVDWQARPQVRGTFGRTTWHCPAAHFRAMGPSRCCLRHWQGGDEPMGNEQQVPLLNAQLEMDEREQINDALTTGLRVSTLPTGHPAVCSLPPLSAGRLSWCCDELCT